MLCDYLNLPRTAGSDFQMLENKKTTYFGFEKNKKIKIRVPPIPAISKTLKNQWFS
jgi:hypothetical protein